MLIIVVKFKDICTKIGSGATPKGGKEAYCEEGISLIRSQNVLDFAFSADGLAFINDLQAEKLKNVIVEEGDVLLNITGDSVARACMVDKKYLPARVNQHVCIVRADPQKAVPSYLLHFLQLNKEYLLQLAAGGATRNALTKEMINNLELELPSIEEQQKIVAILDGIQERMACNNAINENLAELLQSIYQQRFNCSDSNEEHSILADICDYSKEKIAVSSLSVRNYYSTENMLPGKAGAVDASSLPTIAQTTKCTKGDVLISNIRPYFKKIVYCQSDCGCSMDVLCFTPKSPKLSAYLFSTLYADRFFGFMVAGAKGTKMPRGDKQQIMTYSVRVPSDAELDEFNGLATPILAQIESNWCENISLSALREGLLPKLLSGEIDVSNIRF